MKGNKTVHLADDDEDDRMLIREALKEASPDITIVEAEDGKELVHNIKDADDLSNTVIIVDMNMPKMNGIEAIEEIRKDPELPEVPAVMLSTSNNPDLKAKALKAGVNDYYSKPTSFRGLLDIALKIFNRFFRKQAE
jgi:CheY-like chemotaxis protein